jgi:2,3-bisphosphoglycerate-independent phosphoglycerate mutase
MLDNFVLLCVLDGWGMAAPSAGNAITLGSNTNMDRFWASYPHTLLEASGESVGLPRSEPGNTETGHLNLGAGRIVYQDIERINMSIAEGTFFTNPILRGAIDHARKNNSKLHYMGLVGAGGVHSNLEHLFALIQLAKRENFTNLYLHLFTDGRDSPQMSALTYIRKIQDLITRENTGQIASVMGRYWAMDRDFRWERTEKAYTALTRGEGHLVKTCEEAVQSSYQMGKTDEFIEPSILTNAAGQPVSLIGSNDAVIFFNFRIDRPRQLSRAFVIKDFAKASSLQWDYDPFNVKYLKKHGDGVPAPTNAPFARGEVLSNLYFVTMTEYDKYLDKEGAQVAFPPEMVAAPLGRIIADADLRQLRMSESEKERFVTIYFNGLADLPFPGEDRFIIPSPKVSTYDQKPEMSARELTDSLLSRLKENGYSFALVNFANPDMVGHTGNIGAAVNACQVVDECIGKLASFILAYGGTLLITADHGNVEEMINPHTGEIDTEHNANKVPFIAISKKYLGKPMTVPSGILADVAPTVLSLMGIQKPSSMTGKNLLEGI